MKSLRLLGSALVKFDRDQGFFLASGAMPFGCMPGTIVSGLMRGLKRDYRIPFLSIPMTVRNL